MYYLLKWIIEDKLMVTVHKYEHYGLCIYKFDKYTSSLNEYTLNQLDPQYDSASEAFAWQHQNHDG